MTLLAHDYGEYDPAIHGPRLLCPICGYKWLNYTGPIGELPRCPVCGEKLGVQDAVL